MGIAWGLSHYSGSFQERDRELRGRGMRPIQARVALARHACRLGHALLRTQQPFDEARYRAARHSRGR
jgi:transposase